MLCLEKGFAEEGVPGKMPLYFMNNTMSTSIFVGVAWPYAYAPFHVGNLYGSHLPADVFSRFQKLCGNQVMMVSGSDCHGTPITLAAEKEGVKPEEVAQKYHAINTKLLEELHIEYTNWTTTQTDTHTRVVQEMFLDLLREGYIVSQVAKQLYSESESKFMQDRYVEGSCPHCGAEDARGDQCDTCGRVVDALSLGSPRSKTTGEALVVKETENYYLDLEKLQPKLESWLEGQRGTFREWALSETLGWMKEGLRPRAITRDMEYGVALPVDEIPEEQRISNIEGKVLYVWFEAVTGYLSASVEASTLEGEGLGSQGLGQDGWKEFWINEDAEHYYFIGEDNLVFHTINWPAQLLGTGKPYHLPTNVFANKYLMLEGKKISKSKNWIVDTEHLLENYPLDSVRFYLSYIMTGDNQTNFRWEDFYNVNNGVLLAKVGNLVNRVLAFTLKNFGRDLAAQGHVFEEEVRSEIEKAYEETKHLYAHSHVREAVLRAVELAEFGNEYLTKHEFWKLVKEDKEACAGIVYNALGIVHALRVLLAPVMPDFCQRLNELLGYEGVLQQEGVDVWNFEGIAKELLLAEKVAPLVEKFDPEMVEKEMEGLEG